MVYHVIGLMSGSSLDGLDIALVRLEELDGNWSYEILAADCIAYHKGLVDLLKGARFLSVPEFLKLHTAYGHHIGSLVQDFLAKFSPKEPVDFIASHGHTVFHEPQNSTTYQVGDGAAIAAETGLPVISDLRSLDVALAGQGAPIVPIGDRLLFGQYEYLLNLGGIANVSIQSKGLAFDICPCNQLLDYYAQREGQAYDSGGQLATAGVVHDEMVKTLSQKPFYQKAPPKSLANEYSIKEILPPIDALNLSTRDALATSAEHIAHCIATACASHADASVSTQMLVTGGGAFNTHLISRLRELLQPYSIEIIIPESSLIQYKEALVMALIGALRWQGKPNVLATVTGASYDSIGGAIWSGKP
jgi:anhydro-N-acetylmuramic acid kinase